MTFENKVVVVTGAGFPNGIGAGIARCFAGEKARVIITDLEGAPSEKAAAAIPGDVKAMVADAASQEAMGLAAEKIIKDNGRHRDHRDIRLYFVPGKIPGHE